MSLGPIQTGSISPELEQDVVPTIPLLRLGLPEDVAEVIVFLCSEQARWLTGQLAAATRCTCRRGCRPARAKSIRN